MLISGCSKQTVTETPERNEVPETEIKTELKEQEPDYEEAAKLLEDRAQAEFEKAADSSTKYENFGYSPFAFELFEKLPRDKNTVFSPYSIKTALAIAANGADEEAKEEITKTLGIDDLDDFNEYSRALITAYRHNYCAEMSIADSLWLNTDRAGDANFAQNYAENMMKYYFAPVNKVGQADAEAKINAWCEDNTNGKITEIADGGDFYAALLNAVYFKGAWETQFKESATKKSIFTDRDGNENEIDFMNMTDGFNYYEDENIKILSMYYNSFDFENNSPFNNKVTPVMYIVLGNDNRTDITDHLEKLEYCEVNVSIPKFKFEDTEDMVPALTELGITKVFDKSRSSLSEMFDGEKDDIYLDKVKQKAYIDVNENGTEAAAVTEIYAEAAEEFDEEPEIKDFIADRPFTFIIADEYNKEILFMGENAYVQ